jgi:hypothetical protein
MKSYVSASAGITYSAKTEKSNFDLGVAAFHLNKPKQTFLKDDNEFLAMRKVAHATSKLFLMNVPFSTRMESTSTKRKQVIFRSVAPSDTMQETPRKPW